MRKKKARSREAIATLPTDQYKDLQPMTCVHSTHGQIKCDITIFDEGFDNITSFFCCIYYFQEHLFLVCMYIFNNVKLDFEGFLKNKF